MVKPIETHSFLQVNPHVTISAGEGALHALAAPHVAP